MAVTEAIEAAGEIGNTAVNSVKGILIGVVEGVKEVTSSALPKKKKILNPLNRKKNKVIVILRRLFLFVGSGNS